MGTYTGTKNLVLERDPDFPIRVTIQHYGVTDESTVNEQTIVLIAKTINKAYEEHDGENLQVGSLVMSTGNSITEPILKGPQPVLPPVSQPFVASSQPLTSFLV